MIAIIDYGAGNLHSVKNALDFLNAESIVTGDSETILNADKVILPGVGAFGDAMKCLEKSGLVETVKAVAKSKASKGQYTIRKANAQVGETWYGMAYVIVEDASGNVSIMYSNKVSKNHQAKIMIMV
mgnify:CR=1 FL=1